MNPKLAQLKAPVAIAACAVMAMTGSATAGSLLTSAQIRDNSIQSRDIRNGAIRAVDVAAGTLGGAKIRDASLTGADLADGSITGADLRDGSITGADLAPGAVAASVTSYRTIGTALEVAPGAKRSATVTCDTAHGERATGGGGYPYSKDTGRLLETAPQFGTGDLAGDAVGWTVTVRNTSASSNNYVIVRAICAKG